MQRCHCLLQQTFCQLTAAAFISGSCRLANCTSLSETGYSTMHRSVVTASQVAGLDRLHCTSPYTGEDTVLSSASRCTRHNVYHMQYMYHSESDSIIPHTSTKIISFILQPIAQLHITCADRPNL